MDETPLMASWPPGPGALAREIRARDWAATPLGPVEAWPPSLRALVDLMLGSRILMCLLWGPEAILLYNDAYAGSIDGFHPGALGRSAFAVWPGQRPLYEPPFAQALAGEEAAVRGRHLRLTQRDGSLVDGWFDATYTPVRDEAGGVAGVLVQLTDMTERVRTGQLRDAAEAALRESEERYRAVFESVNEGFSLLEVQLDAAGRAVDLTVRDANPAQDRIDGLRALVGRRLREALPGVAETWIERYGAVARTGEPVQFEERSEATGRWYEVGASRVGGPGSRLVAVVQSDVTGRRRAAALLRASEERQAFLLRLSDALRPLSDPAAIEGEACRLLADALGVERAHCVTLDEARGVARVERDVVRGGGAPLAGEHPLAAFAWFVALLRRDAHVVADTRTSPLVPEADRPACAALGIVACMGAPLVRGGRLEGALCVSDGRPRAWAADEIGLLHEVADRVWAAIVQARAEAELRESEESFRAIVETATDYAIFTTDPEGRIAAWPPGAEAVLGWSAAEAVGRPVEMTFTPEDREAGAPAAERRQAREEGQAPNVRWHLRKDGSRVFIDGVMRPLRRGDGALAGFLKVGQDVTEARETQERLKVLVGELQHRTRNLMAVVQALARRTLAEAATLGEFEERFQDRMGALARVNALLSRLEGGDRIPFDGLVRSELAAHGALDRDGGGPQVTLDGPGRVPLRSGTVQTLALALHELATNAVKYGALAQGEGRLLVRWRHEGDPRDPRAGPLLRVEWIESGVVMPDPEAAPQGTGLGRELIERALPHQLGAETAYALGPDGVRCSIVLPLSSRESAREGRGEA